MDISRFIIDPSKSIGKGGEADVYQISKTHALKLFKKPNHPDLKGFPDDQKLAKSRIAEHQIKLKSMPTGLPPKVIVPEELVTERGVIIGYTMRFIDGADQLHQYSDISFRNAVPSKKVVNILCDLHKTVNGVHSKLVLGDFNSLNVLVLGDSAHIIDIDSSQFGPFYCRMFTTKFLDPLLCDPKTKEMELAKPYVADSDWYAFSIMLLNSLILVGPYGGVYRPKDKSKRVPHDKRPLYRISIFRSDVIYPKSFPHYSILPDDLLHYLYQMYEKDVRGTFPFSLLESIRWTHCSKCGIEHARNICPNCALAVPPAIKEVTVIRGRVTATRIFQTNGVILFSALQRGKLNWLYHENNQFKRENRETIHTGSLDPQTRFRLFGDSTLVAKRNRIVTFKTGTRPEVGVVDSYRNLPIFDTNEQHKYWLENGTLVRDGTFGPEPIGNILKNQTLFWVGSHFGFGFYRAGNISVAFVFDAKTAGINDSVKLPVLRGQLIDSTCVFSKKRCWFFVSTQEGGDIINQCIVITSDGKVEAISKTKRGNNSWLSSIRGKCAVNDFLFSPTDEGIIRLETQEGQIIQTRSFPDTESFVDLNCYLFAGKGELYVVGRQKIISLKIS